MSEREKRYAYISLCISTILTLLLLAYMVYDHTDTTPHQRENVVWCDQYTLECAA